MTDERGEHDERDGRNDRNGRTEELAPVPEEERLRRVQELEKQVPPGEDERPA